MFFLNYKIINMFFLNYKIINIENNEDNDHDELGVDHLTDVYSSFYRNSSIRRR